MGGAGEEPTCGVWVTGEGVDVSTGAFSNHPDSLPLPELQKALSLLSKRSHPQLQEDPHNEGLPSFSQFNLVFPSWQQEHGFQLPRHRLGGPAWSILAPFDPGVTRVT